MKSCGFFSAYRMRLIWDLLQSSQGMGHGLDRLVQESSWYYSTFYKNLNFTTIIFLKTICRPTFNQYKKLLGVSGNCKESPRPIKHSNVISVKHILGSNSLVNSKSSLFQIALLKTVVLIYLIQKCM